MQTEAVAMRHRAQEQQPTIASSSSSSRSSPIRIMGMRLEPRSRVVVRRGSNSVAGTRLRLQTAGAAVAAVAAAVAAVAGVGANAAARPTTRNEMPFLLLLFSHHRPHDPLLISPSSSTFS
jgi:hypothetical protein